MTCEVVPAILLLMLLPIMACAEPIADQQKQAADWLDRFAYTPPVAAKGKPCSKTPGKLPAFGVTPASAGKQLVRVSLPFPMGALKPSQSLVVKDARKEIVPDVRVLTCHPCQPPCVRRAIVTFPYQFAGVKERQFKLAITPRKEKPSAKDANKDGYRARIGDLDLSINDSSVRVLKQHKELWRADLIAPARTWTVPAQTCVVEHGQHYLWIRVMVPDALWPRIIEVRADSLGTVAVRAHLQRLEDKDGYAPDLGWRIAGGRAQSLVSGETRLSVGTEQAKHSFGKGESAAVLCRTERMSFPDAHLLKRGEVTARNTGEGSDITYLRCKADELVPMQPAAWRTASFIIGPNDSAPWNALLEPPHAIHISSESFDAIYGCGRPADLSKQKVLSDLTRYHHYGITHSTKPGDDFGNLTWFPDSVFGMNRLNHCPPIFMEYFRSGDMSLRESALHWCDNFSDLSIWWGTNREEDFGGTRYNDVRRQSNEHQDDKSFMWRSNTAVNFCTKGIDSFLFAYEETGDPRMAAALRWQIDYSLRMVHAGRDYCRDIGEVSDFMRLYKYTGHQEYLDKSLALFNELRGCLSDGDLFTESGKPIDRNPPFIDEDQQGYEHPFAKPYIIGYALNGLPELSRYCPDEPKLRDVVRAVADFVAASVDPAGGWRYPHPRSRYMVASQAIEHAGQLTRAAALLESRGEKIDNLLDAIECVLQARVLVWQKTGEFFNAVSGWEDAASVLKDGKKAGDLYKRPEDRDQSRDYTEGAISLGGSAPEGIVYFSEVLDFYLKHRPAERLFIPNAKLKILLDRMKEKSVETSDAKYPRYGMADKLPTFYSAQVSRLTFPLAYDAKRYPDFGKWRKRARAKLLDCLLTPPLKADFRLEVVAREDRGTYEARKILFNVSADCRIPAYLLVPKGKGPFPAVIALHDHGAHFTIGKEKVIRPFGESRMIQDDAQEWVKQCYGGRFIGDELAKRGYVVFSMDALFWGDRGRREGVEHTAQQELAANLLQMGMCWSGVIAWDDIRSAEFVASLTEVDKKRIGAIGLSVGSHRTWMLCAASDIVSCGAAICWMGTTKSLMVPGNNQTTGQSAFSMLVPNLRNFLDYPDIASIACPKPMLFYNGEQDPLFPVDGVKDAYTRMRGVWSSRNAGGKLVTELWPVPHVFNVEMQEKAFNWLDTCLRKRL